MDVFLGKPSFKKVSPNPFPELLLMFFLGTLLERRVPNLPRTFDKGRQILAVLCWGSIGSFRPRKCMCGLNRSFFLEPFLKEGFQTSQELLTKDGKYLPSSVGDQSVYLGRASICAAFIKFFAPLSFKKAGGIQGQSPWPPEAKNKRNFP